MSRFNEKNFYNIIDKIETMEVHNENIWVPVGILEVMYDDNYGYIDNFFHKEFFDRNVVNLWWNLQAQLDKIEGDDLK